MPIFQYKKRILPLVAVAAFPFLLILSCNHPPPNHFENEFYRQSS